MEVRSRCHVCAAPVDLSAGAAAPVVCGRQRCRVGVERERLIVPVLLERPEWLDATEIARSAGLAVNAARTVLARMVRRGWVEWRRDRVRRRPCAGRPEFRLTGESAPMARLLIGCAAKVTAGAVR